MQYQTDLSFANLEPFLQDHELSVGRGYLFLASKQVTTQAVLSELCTDCVVLAQSQTYRVDLKEPRHISVCHSYQKFKFLFKLFWM